MLIVFGILYVVLHAIMLAVEAIRYRRMYDHLTVMSYILNEITFVSELLKIQGFPDDYILYGTQAEQKKYIGNAVEVTTSRVLCEALADVINAN